MNPHLQQRLLDEALEDPSGETDPHGHPRKLWNAVAGTVFFGKSTGEREPRYNCYPALALTTLHDELMRRKARARDEVLG